MSRKGKKAKGIRVAVTSYVRGRNEQTTWFVMPAVPQAGETIHFDDSAWRVDHVSWAPDDDTIERTEGVTDRETTWHAEIGVSR